MTGKANSQAILTNEYYPDGLTPAAAHEYYQKVAGTLIPNMPPQGQSLELLEVMGSRTKVAWITVEPKAGCSFEAAQHACDDLLEQVGDSNNIADVRVKFSGDNSFHVLLDLMEEVDTDSYRDELQDYLMEYAALNDLDQVSLDVKALRPSGSISATYSLSHKTGLVSVPLSKEAILHFQKEDAIIPKILGSQAGSHNAQETASTLGREGDQGVKPYIKDEE